MWEPTSASYREEEPMTQVTRGWRLRDKASDGSASLPLSLSIYISLYLSYIQFEYMHNQQLHQSSFSLSALAKRDQRNSSRKYKHLSWINTATGLVRLRPIVWIVRLSTQFDLLICISFSAHKSMLYSWRAKGLSAEHWQWQNQIVCQKNNIRVFFSKGTVTWIPW